jgi:hypothetical protein
MPPPPKPTLPRAADARHGRNFDPWNSVALGHQRAEARGPQGWRENRTWKLQNQLAGGHSGGDRLSDRVGAGSEDFDDRRRVLIPKEVRARAANSVVDMLRRPGTMNEGKDSGSSRPASSRSPERQQLCEEEEKEGEEGEKGEGSRSMMTAEEEPPASSQQQPKGEEMDAAATAANTGGQSSTSSSTTGTTGRKIFDSLVIYVNGSTHPHVSDHRLRHLLVQNGARMSIHLGRRQVTHVILGKPSTPNTNSGAGGGLAGGKLDREIRRVGGCGVKYVGVEW